MKGLIAFLLLLHFQTQAKEIITLGNASKVVQIPDDCLKTKVSCAFKTSKDEKFKFLIGKTQIVLDQNTAVFRKAENSILLVSGQIWIRARGNLKVQTEYGEAALEGGNFLIRNQENRMEVLAIDNDLILTPKMGKVGLRLEAGEQNWIGPVDANHAATSGVLGGLAFERPGQRRMRIQLNKARRNVDQRVEVPPSSFQHADRRLAVGAQAFCKN